MQSKNLFIGLVFCAAPLLLAAQSRVHSARIFSTANTIMEKPWFTT